ncbi:hypothetical protein GCM10007301_49690 [Azorhizobium oxalatiphilum]|uniref:N-acetyltransferase domain-containing protein n=1 Tax=Azorhizobium oxalatiphilum TaxID=980631 RepID=A0A917FJK4_9HYPH|nr:GNAT family N-acetyltransferase [Azorhizobium oxalatiphilum]GGF83737.1 hypothetical protein GCM10007301_49690 [Azorhizobium oxalatiphilum]
MFGDVILRLARDGDLDRLRAISAEARQRYGTLAGLAHVADATALDRERFAPCRVMIAVAEDETQILGFAMTRPLDGLLYLDNISVDPACSGQGIGPCLLADVLAHAAASGAPAIALTTFREPKWNGPWFRRHGFQAMPAAHIGPGLRAVMDRQALTLDPATRETLWRPARPVVAPA